MDEQGVWKQQYGICWLLPAQTVENLCTPKEYIIPTTEKALTAIHKKARRVPKNVRCYLCHMLQFLL